MSTRLQIILVSIIALMAGLGFTATALVLHHPAPHFFYKKVDAPMYGAMSPIAQATALIPSGSRVITAYPLSVQRYWVLAEKGELWQTWSVDIASGNASLLNERENGGAKDIYLTLISHEIEPPTEFRDYLVIRRNYGWESPPWQQIEVIDAKSGMLVVSAEWSLDRMILEKDGKKMTVSMSYEKPCTITTGESVTEAEGLLVNETIVRFPRPVEAGCAFSHFSGQIYYDGFNKPSFHSYTADNKRYIAFYTPKGEGIWINLEKFDATGVSFGDLPTQ